MKNFWTNRMRLLEKVCYTSRRPTKSKNILGETITVIDTFPYNPESKTAPDTAKRWAQHHYYNSKDYEPEIVTRDNEPFEVTVVDLDVRSQGGRAYKVIDGENRRFDLREDQVLDVMRLVGIGPGGRIPAQFVWGVLGSQMRLVLVGGTLHTEMTKQLQDLKSYERSESLGLTPTPGTLRVGHVYRKRDQTKHLFLGKVKLPKQTKTMFAFIEVPEPPLDEDEYEDITNDDGTENWYLAKNKKALLAWPTWSWAARFDWAERGKYESHPAHRRLNETECIYREHIVLMASPKFECEESFTIDTKPFLDEAAIRGINDVQKNDIAELDYEAKHGKRAWYDNSSYPYGTPREEVERRRAAFTESVRQKQVEYRKAYYAEMTWL